MNWISIKDKLPEYNKKIIAALSVYSPFEEKILTYSYDVGIYCCEQDWKLQYWTTERLGSSGFKLNVEYWSYVPIIEVKGINDGKL